MVGDKVSTLMGFYLYGAACLVTGFVFGAMWKDNG